MTPLSNYSIEDVENAVAGGKFEPAQRLTRGQFELLEPVWMTAFAYETVNEKFGKIELSLSSSLATAPSVIFLGLRLGLHRYYVGFSSELWAAALQDACEADVDILDHEETAALALEVYFAEPLEAIEAFVGQQVSLETLSKQGPKPSATDLPRIGLGLKTSSNEVIHLELFSDSPAGAKALVAIIEKSGQRQVPSRNAAPNIRLASSLMADVTKIPGEQLKSIAVGNGILLGANWQQTSDLTLVIDETVVATIECTDDAYVVSDLRLTSSEKPENPTKPRRRKDTATRRNEEASAND